MNNDPRNNRTFEIAFLCTCLVLGCAAFWLSVYVAFKTLLTLYV